MRYESLQEYVRLRKEGKCGWPMRFERGTVDMSLAAIAGCYSRMLSDLLDLVPADLVDAAIQAAQEVEGRKAKTCEWYQKEVDRDIHGREDIWYTGCGQVFMLPHASPEEHFMTHCAFCGCALIERKERVHHEHPKGEAHCPATYVRGAPAGACGR